MGRLSIFDKIIDHEESPGEKKSEENLFDEVLSPLVSNLDKVC
jgi:hypothetical protein